MHVLVRDCVTWLRSFPHRISLQIAGNTFKQRDQTRERSNFFPKLLTLPVSSYRFSLCFALLLEPRCLLSRTHQCWVNLCSGTVQHQGIPSNLGINPLLGRANAAHACDKCENTQKHLERLTRLETKMPRNSWASEFPRFRVLQEAAPTSPVRTWA